MTNQYTEVNIWAGGENEGKMGKGVFNKWC
jgi:hypothetical protein